MKSCTRLFFLLYFLKLCDLCNADDFFVSLQSAFVFIWTKIVHDLFFYNRNPQLKIQCVSYYLQYLRSMDDFWYYSLINVYLWHILTKKFWSFLDFCTDEHCIFGSVQLFQLIRCLDDKIATVIDVAIIKRDRSECAREEKTLY